MKYQIARRIARAPVMNWKGFLLLGGAVFVISQLESCTAKEIIKKAVAEKNATITAKNVRCTVGSVSKDGTMHLNCPGKGNTVLVSTSLALDYSLKPRPLMCTVFRGNTPDCKFAAHS